MKNYVTIAKACHYEYEISRSKFITNLINVQSLQEGLSFVADIKKRFSDATHNCYAIVGLPYSNEIKYSDDSEPSGTAGQPILNAIVHNKLEGVACVVTRYFGGVKLGAGGLTNAYSTAVAQCIAIAELAEYKYACMVALELAYSEYKLFNIAISDIQNCIFDTQFSDIVTISVAVPQQQETALNYLFTQITKGSERYKIIEKKYVKFEV